MVRHRHSYFLQPFSYVYKTLLVPHASSNPTFDSTASIQIHVIAQKSYCSTADHLPNTQNVFKYERIKTFLESTNTEIRNQARVMSISRIPTLRLPAA